MAKELVQTKGSVRIEGQVVGFDGNNENSYRTGDTKAGKPYRSVSLTVKTAPNNVVYNNDLFGQVPSKKVKIFSNKNGEKKNLEIDFEERNNMPDGFTCFGFGSTGLGFERNDKGSIKMKNQFNFDAAETIKNGVDNDASVWIDGEFNINTYESNGEKKTNVKYTINRIGLKDPIDFDQENFKEVASFEQEFVVTQHELDKESKKLYVGARIISWDKTWKDITFVVDGEKFPQLAQNIYKKTKFGDLLHVEGIIRNGTVIVEAEEEVEINWGGETPTGQGKKMNRNKISELQISNVKKHTPKVYKEEDFIIEANPFTEDSNNDLPWGDLSEDDENPFA